jgi:hypothetical protein
VCLAERRFERARLGLALVLERDEDRPPARAECPPSQRHMPAGCQRRRCGQQEQERGPVGAEGLPQHLQPALHQVLRKIRLRDAAGQRAEQSVDADVQGRHEPLDGLQQQRQGRSDFGQGALEQG